MVWSVWIRDLFLSVRSTDNPFRGVVAWCWHPKLTGLVGVHSFRWGWPYRVHQLWSWFRKAVHDCRYCWRKESLFRWFELWIGPHWRTCDWRQETADFCRWRTKEFRNRWIVCTWRTSWLPWSVVPKLPLWRRRSRLVRSSLEEWGTGEVENKWNETAWAKKLAARAKKAASCDFCRFKARFAKKH